MSTRKMLLTILEQFSKNSRLQINQCLDFIGIWNLRCKHSVNTYSTRVYRAVKCEFGLGSRIADITRSSGSFILACFWQYLTSFLHYSYQFSENTSKQKNYIKRCFFIGKNYFISMKIFYFFNSFSSSFYNSNRTLLHIFFKEYRKFLKNL